uniref:Uncharacterized protein n=1 Tax=viral metagenome TaxID=1070528 RepID=A0A6C0KRF3_9ZZZZ
MSQLNSQRTYLYLLYNEIIYDTLCNNYVNILTLNKSPEGALKPYTKLMALTKPYTRDLITATKECAYVINNNINNNINISNNITSHSNILTLDELNEFTEFLINNNYVITEYSYSGNNNNTATSNSNSNSTKKIIYSFKITL